MNILLFLTVFIFTIGNAQNQRFSYVYQFIPDSTNQADVKSEMMILEVVPKFSKFYSETVFKSDSIAKVILEKEASATGSINIKSDMRKGLFRNTIIKESLDFKTFLVTKIGRSKLKVSDQRKFNWKILPEKQKIGDFEVQQAETEMYGRIWTAWFTTQIPIQDGPYKFQGLPGLIVKIEDETKSHSFQLSGIKNLNQEEIEDIDPNNNFIFDSGEYIKMDLAAYKKFYLENRNDHNKSVRHALGQIEEVSVKFDGKEMDINEHLRNKEKQKKQKNARDNNLLELDLLK